MIAHLHRRPLFVGLEAASGDGLPFPWPLCAVEQVARLLRFAAGRITSGPAPWAPDRRVVFGRDGGVLERKEDHSVPLWPDTRARERHNISQRGRGESIYRVPHHPSDLAAVVAAAVMPGGIQVFTEGADKGSRQAHGIAMPGRAEVIDGSLVIDLVSPSAGSTPLAMDVTLPVAGDRLRPAVPSGARLKPAQIMAMDVWHDAFASVVPHPADGVDPLVTREYVTVARMSSMAWMETAWPQPPFKPGDTSSFRAGVHADRFLLWQMLSGALVAGAIAFRVDGRVMVPQSGDGLYDGGSISLESGQLAPLFVRLTGPWQHGSAPPSGEADGQEDGMVTVHVLVEGDPSEEEDQSVAGAYKFRVDRSLSEGDRASAALDCFACCVPIAVLDDFGLRVFDAAGNEMTEGDAESYSLDDRAVYLGPCRDGEFPGTGKILTAP